MRKRNLNLKKYNISNNRYKELEYFCRQYPEKIQKLNSICSISSIKYGSISSTSIGDRTGEEAQKRIELTKDIQIIEECAKEASEELYSYIIKNVCFEVPYERLNIPVSRTSYFRLRRKFFYILSKNK